MIRDIPNQYKSPFLSKVAGVIRARHYSYRTEQTYIGWILRYIRYHDKRHPAEMGPPEVSAFLTHLAVNEHVAASTQNQGIFLYRGSSRNYAERGIWDDRREVILCGRELSDSWGLL